MNAEPFLPTIDLMPLPAPFWLFKLLLLVTFILHLVAMNLMFGGGVIAVATRWLGGKSEFAQRLSRDLAKKIPSFLAATVTLGVAPLLFLQVTYGQFFYTSSVLIAWPWFLVVVLLVVAYYGFYSVALAKNQTTKRLGWIMLLSVCLIAVIGFFLSNNMTLMLTPAKWLTLYQGNPSGWNLNLSEASLIPRYLHFVVAAIAIGGLLLVINSFFRWRQENDYARFLLITGGKWFLYTTMLQFLIGLWFLFSLPKEKMLLGLGGNLLATLCLGIGLMGGLVALVMMSRAIRTADPRRGALVAIILTGVVIIVMAIWRDILRSAYLESFFNSGTVVVKTQPGVLALFLILLALGILLWLWMMRKYFSAAFADVNQ